jgi:aryl-alcohol dehydrogenase-like predicted oxidoreductase
MDKHLPNMNKTSLIIPRTELASGYSISRVIAGFWQLAGGHGMVEKKKALMLMRLFLEGGITTFDCADIYTGVEELIGEFLSQNRTRILSKQIPPVQVHTKYVPDLDVLPTLSKKYTEAVIDRSLRRLRIERVDLVQFHWWDFDIPGFVDTALHLADIQRAGKIRSIGTTNFDALHLRELLEAGVPLVSNQVQYSVLDRRPEKNLLELTRKYGFRLLCYGTVAGGFLSERYFGKYPPDEPLENRSLIKYRLIIEEFGGFDLFKELLHVLWQIAERHTVGIAEVAIRYILQKPMVGGVIIGARNSRHLPRLQRLYSFQLDQKDMEQIKKVLSRAKGPSGPVYGLERDREGAHGRIMKYNLNRVKIE